VAVLFGQSITGAIGSSATQNAYNQQLAAIAQNTTGSSKAAYSKKWGQDEMRFTVEKVANGYVLRLAGGYGDMVSLDNTYVAADIKELGDLFISTVVNHQLDK